MRRVARLLVPVVILAAMVPPISPAPAQEEGRKVTLLIGVDKYDGTGLRNLEYAEKDVTDLAAVLEKQGYKVTLVTRSEFKKRDLDHLLPTAGNVRDHLAAVTKNRNPADTVLVAFSGHGVHLKTADKLFYCPTGAKLDDPKTLVGIDEVLDAFKGCKAGSKVLLMDACRNDPADGRTTGTPNEVKSTTRPLVPDPPGGTVVMFSCSKGQIAYESKTHGRGFLFHFVIEGLSGKAANPKTGQVTWLGLAKYVDDELPDAVRAEKGPKAEQSPEVRGDARGLVLASVAGAGRPAPMAWPCTPKEARASQERWAKYLGRKVEEEIDLGGGVTMTFVLIPPGTFRMGAPDDEKDAYPDERPRHEVELDGPVYLARYECTQVQYGRLAGRNPSWFDGKEDNKAKGLDTAGFPVEQVDWTEAAGWCAALGKKAVGWRAARLPTEAEWEWACRAGTDARFHTGTKLDAAAANFARKLDRPWVVGSGAANAFGLYDMHGNVWEWCSDRYGLYPDKKVRNPAGPPDGKDRIRRGGAWDATEWDCRSADRLGGTTTVRSDNLGFRPVLVP